MQDGDKKVSLTSFCTVLSLKPGEILLTRRNFGIARVVKHGRDFLGGGEVLILRGFQEQIRETSVKNSLCS